MFCSHFSAHQEKKGHIRDRKRKWTCDSKKITRSPAIKEKKQKPLEVLKQ
jgi:hypothetical protein